MQIKKFKIIFQNNKKKEILFLKATSLSQLRNHEEYPSNVLFVKEIIETKWSLNRKHITKIEVIDLFDEINIMLQAGLTFQETIDILLDKYSIKNQEYHILETIIISLKQGIPIYIGLEKYRHILGDFILSFIRLGEQKSNMKEAINSICIVLLKDNRNKEQITKQLSYPILLIITLMIAIAIIFMFVIPKFEYMFGQLGASLPLVTQVLLQIKSFLFSYSHIIVICLLLLGFSIWIVYIKSLKFKYNIDKILLVRIPLISRLLMTQQMYRFFLVLKVLIASGYKLQEALISSKTIIGNSYFTKQIQIIEMYLKQGKDVSDSFEYVNIFDALTIRLLLAGEKTNDMYIIMEKLEMIYDKQLQNSMHKISSSLEPILIAIIGLIILFIMLAIFLPIWQMGTVLG